MIKYKNCFSNFLHLARSLVNVLNKISKNVKKWIQKLELKEFIKTKSNHENKQKCQELQIVTYSTWDKLNEYHETRNYKILKNTFFYRTALVAASKIMFHLVYI